MTPHEIALQRPQFVVRHANRRKIAELLQSEEGRQFLFDGLTTKEEEDWMEVEIRMLMKSLMEVP